MSAPWPSPASVALALTICGLGGFGYGAIVIRRATRQTEYKPVWEDWLWHSLVPCSLYTSLALAALLLRSATRPALFVTAAAALGLLLVGIHNAWDSVTHIVVGGSRDEAGSPLLPRSGN